MCNLYFISLFISIWKTGVENNTRAQCPLPFCICWVQYNTVVQYNHRVQLWSYTVDNIYITNQFCRGGGGRWGSYELLYCSPLLSSCYLYMCPASQVKKNQAHLLRREPLSWFCVSDLLLLKRRELTTRCNPRWLENPNSSLTQYECGRMKPLLCPRHHRQVKQAVKT